ncbi:hypothetical protein KI387_032494 [Taxus chinensis]|uniref:Uncharacterized protein n=1 Tax=Taxus chinensis TaxID=29808 RepID=A0AA38BRZ5_TAXCH|nr:hypothetical protein KI387_032494 [Taxus chinensis]
MTKSSEDFQTLAHWSEDYRLSQDMQVVMTLIDSTLNQEQTDLDELKMIIGIVNACLKERGEYRPSMREIVRALTQKVPIRALPVEDGDGDEKLNTIYYSAYSDSYMEKIVMQRMLLQLKEFKDEVTAKTQKVVVELLKGAGKIHWVGAPLSVVGFVLARFGQMSSN